MLTFLFYIAIIILPKLAQFVPKFEKFAPLFDMGDNMQPLFNVSREKTNQLYCSKSYKNDFCYLQFHSPIEILGVTEGEMEAFVDGKQKLLKAGDVLVVLSYVGHEYKTPNSSNSFMLTIPTHLCEEFLNQTNGKKLKTPFFSDPEFFSQLKSYFDTISDKNSSTLKKHALANVILALVLENGELIDDNKPANNQLISQILFYISQNFKNDISPFSIAEHFGYSQSHISRYFKNCCNVNLSRYINLVRLKNFIILMDESKFDTTYCALESGFTSMRTFYRCFRSEFGCSPKEYMQKLH